MADRDLQTLLSGYRTKYPKYAKVDDATLYSAIVKAHPQYKDISFNAIPKHETFLQKLINSPGGNTAVATAVGGPILGSYYHASEDPNPPEDLAPGATIMATSMIPGMQGFGADVMGAYGGEYGKQVIKKMRGEEGAFQKPITNSLLTGLISGITRGVGATSFGSRNAQSSLNEAKDAFGKVMEKIKGLGGDKAKIPFPWLKGSLNDALSSGEFSNTKTMKDLGVLAEKLGKYQKTGVPFEKAHNIETELGHLGKFPNPVTGAMMNEKVPANINQIVTNLRNNVSGMVDRRAASLGAPEFADISKQMSGAFKKVGDYAKMDKTVSKVLANPLAVFGLPNIAYQGAKAVANPLLDLLYPAAKAGVGKVARGEAINQAQRAFNS